LLQAIGRLADAYKAPQRGNKRVHEKLGGVRVYQRRRRVLAGFLDFMMINMDY
jgi:hypothetical protein